MLCQQLVTEVQLTSLTDNKRNTHKHLKKYIKHPSNVCVNLIKMVNCRQFLYHIKIPWLCVTSMLVI